MQRLTTAAVSVPKIALHKRGSNDRFVCRTTFTRERISAWIPAANETPRTGHWNDRYREELPFVQVSRNAFLRPINAACVRMRN